MFKWPVGVRAAVSLTYDDARESQIWNVAPALERHHLRGTFFVHGIRLHVGASLASEWVALWRRGHELGSHSMVHPCLQYSGENDLKRYDTARLVKELDDSINNLKELTGFGGPFTYAYPCGDTTYGPDRSSSVPLVSARFFAARGASPQRIIIPGSDCMANTPAVSGNQRGDTLVSLVDEAVSREGWVVFVFHDVGPEPSSEMKYYTTNIADHEKLLEYLEDHHDTLWIDTFGNIARYIEENTREHS